MVEIDDNGYIRGKVEHTALISRQIAKTQIYDKNPTKYPLPFGKYVVHHIDRDKLNNSVKNLAILTPLAHKKIHGIPLTEEEKAYELILNNLKNLNGSTLKGMLERMNKG